MGGVTKRLTAAYSDDNYNRRANNMNIKSKNSKSSKITKSDRAIKQFFFEKKKMHCGSLREKTKYLSNVLTLCALLYILSCFTCCPFGIIPPVSARCCDGVGGCKQPDWSAACSGKCCAKKLQAAQFAWANPNSVDLNAASEYKGAEAGDVHSHTAQENGGGGCCGGAGGGNKHGAHHIAMEGNKSPCCGVMPMWFQSTTHTVILFRGWETIEKWQFILSCIACVIFGIISVLFKLMRLRIEGNMCRREAAVAISESSGTSSGGTGGQDVSVGGREGIDSRMICADGHCSHMNSSSHGNIMHGGNVGTNWKDKSFIGIPLWNNWWRMLQAFVIYSWDYLLMLIVMTFNVWLFVSVCLGLGLGFFFVGHKLRIKTTATGGMGEEKGGGEIEQFKADPACCGA